MIELIAHWQIKEGHEDQAWAALDDMFEVVQNKQCGVLLYIVSSSVEHDGKYLTQPPPPSREVVFWETYASGEVFDEHVEWQKHYMKENGYLDHFVLPSTDAKLPTFKVEFLHRKKALIRKDYPGAVH